MCIATLAKQTGWGGNTTFVTSIPTDRHTQSERHRERERDSERERERGDRESEQEKRRDSEI